MKTKHIIIFFNVLVLLISALFPMTSHAQSSDNQRAIYIFRNDGDFNAFLNMDVDSITFSRIDLNGHEHPNVVVKEIWTPDSLYRIPLAAIDSINFNAPDPVFKSDLFHITEDHIPYVVDTAGLSIDFNTSIPASMLPDIGQVMISDVYEGPFENGFAGRVTQIYDTDGILRVQCDTVSFKDVYEQYIYVGKTLCYGDSVSPRSTLQSTKGDTSYVSEWPIGNFSFDLVDNGAWKVTLEITPRIVHEYIAHYDANNPENSIFKNIVHCSLDGNILVNISHDFIHVDTTFFSNKKPKRIPLGKNMYAEIRAGLFVHCRDSIAMELGNPFRFRTQFNFGYDSQKRHNGLGGLFFNFDRNEMAMDDQNDLYCVVKINGLELSIGLDLNFSFFMVSEALAKSVLDLKIGPKLSGAIDLDTRSNDIDINSLYNSLKDRKLELGLATTLNFSSSIFGLHFNDLEYELPTRNWGDHYLVPEFTLLDFAMPELPNLNENNGYTSATLATTISRNLLFPIKPGIGLYDNNNELRYASYSDYYYWLGGTDGNAWAGNPLTIELNNTEYEVGTYTAAPIFKFFGRTVKASPFTHVTIPAERLSVDKTNIDLQQGDTVYIQQTGGWGKYALYSDPSPQSVYSATFIDDEHDVTCASWPPDTSSVYENVSPKIRIIGNQVGGASLIVKDLRSGDIETISVNVGEYQPIIVNADSLDFGIVKVGETSLPKSLNVTCSGISDNLTVKLEEDVSGQFTVNPSTLGPFGGIIRVTFAPESNRGYSGVIIISGTTIRGEFVSKKVYLKGNGINPSITIDTCQWDFGDILKDEIITKTFNVTGTDISENLTVSLQSIGIGNLSIDTSTLDANGGTVTVTFVPQKSGNCRGVMTICGDDVTKTVTLTGKGIDPSITTNPSTLNFGEVGVGGTTQAKITVTCTDISDNLTVKLEDVSGQFTVSPTTLGPYGGKINVTFAPESKRGYSGEITISGTSILGDVISKTVSLNGEGVIPKITANPSSLTGFTRDYKTQTFTVTGSHLTGNLNLTSQNADFRVSPTSISAAEAKNGKTVTVTFTPQSYIKAIPGRITISGGGADTVYVNLSGNGRASNNPPVTINSIEPDDLSGEND